jgi:ATP-dependent HslUV protease ATP-binding subunit HslU
MSTKELTPKEIVAELDKYIVGQQDAKKSVAIALRNRYRRQLLSPDMKEEVMPKNIIMIGPTGVGKTEIARRLAKLVHAPFVKVEATKFTEVGYVGRDVDAIVRDLTEIAVRLVKDQKLQAVQEKAARAAEERLLDLLAPLPRRKKEAVGSLNMFFAPEEKTEDRETDDFQSRYSYALREREAVLCRLRAGDLEKRTVEIEVEDKGAGGPMMDVFQGQGMEEMGFNFNDILGSLMPKKSKRRKVPVGAARKIIQQQEAQKFVDMDETVNEAIELAENSGIVFIDEIDKVAGKDYRSGPDVSREGVQRDILPIVEGSTVMTKYGPVKTDFMLFIAAGAFHVSSPSDLIPELQGRFPLRVELKSLTEKDFARILTEPRNALIKQYISLLKTEGIDITFTQDAILEVARTACTLNEEMENIGARRLHTILEKIVEEISFNAPEYLEKKVIIDGEYVKNKLEDVLVDKDLSKFIL